MVKPVEVKALPNYKLWVKYSDGVQGEVDLSHLVGRVSFYYGMIIVNFKRFILERVVR